MLSPKEIAEATEDIENEEDEVQEDKQEKNAPQRLNTHIESQNYMADFLQCL